MCDLLCQQGQRQYWPTGFSEYARRQSECPPATSLSAASTWWGVPGRDMADLTGDQRRSAALVASCGLFSCLVGALWAILGLSEVSTADRHLAGSVLALTSLAPASEGLVSLFPHSCCHE